MPNFNKVLLAGNLTRDPEQKQMPQGSAVAKFGMAINRRYKGGDGELKEETTFVDVSTFSHQAETVSKFLMKGAAVLVEGRLKFDRWDDKTPGQKKSKLYVIAERVQFLWARRAASDAPGAPDNGNDAMPVGVAGAGLPPEDDAPF